MRIKLLLLFILFTLSLGAKELKIASWNLKNVSLNSLLFKKSISKINNYISSKKDFDVIALQELRDRQIIYFLSGGIKDIFFSDFKRIISKAKGKKTHKEVYGFLVNDKYKNIKQIDFYNYRSFARPPFGIILDDKYAIVNLHIIYGKYKKQRIKEVKNLKKIITKLQKKHNIDPKNIIFVGDFNLTSKDIKKLYPKMSVYINEKTTVGTKKMSKSYDHFLTNIKGAKTSARSDIIGDIKFFRKNISDHVPIEGVFNLK